MYRCKQYGSVARFGVVIAVAILLLTGVTFAALTSQNATLLGNTITSATANLQIGDSAGNFGATATGFTFSNVEPGSSQWAPTSGQMVTFKNTGTTTLSLQANLKASSILNTQNVDLAKVSFGFTPATGGTIKPVTLDALKTAYTGNNAVPLGITVAPGQTTQVKVQAQIAADAITTTTAGFALSGLDLVFSGVSVAS